MRFQILWLFLVSCCLHVIDGQGDKDIRPFLSSRKGVVQGPRKRWHRITIGFRGPTTHEKHKFNPFMNYRLDATFTHRDTKRKYVVPGYYAADGDAANTGATRGNVWLVHFAPDLVGTWDYTVSFVSGNKVAVNGGGNSAGFFDKQSGSFDVQETDKTGRDHRSKGRLDYVNKHHLRFANGEWFLKGGADSPENFLAYDDFDGTPNIKERRKSWSPHLRDSRPKDSTWAGGKGKAIQGALNYLALEKGMNAFSFITMNIEGDDKNVFPYISNVNTGDNYQRIDVSKTAQWEVVFSHADKLGLYMHFKTQETENDQLLDGGRLGLERKLYYRELIARFGHHLALNWNIGEENSNTPKQRLQFAAYFRENDPYRHPIVIHTFPNPKEKNKAYGGIVGKQGYTGISIQAKRVDIYSDTLKWVNQSDALGKPWVVANDEQAGAGLGVVPDGEAADKDHNDARAKVLWGNLMAGGAGVEYYFGFRFRESDLTLQDFRSRDQLWDQTRTALNFFRDNKIPFWEMSAYKRNEFGKTWCLADKRRNTILMYLPNLRNLPKMSLFGSPKTRYSVRWFNPRSGRKLEVGSVRSLNGGEKQEFGLPPNSDINQDWVVLFRRNRGTAQLTPPTTTKRPMPTTTTTKRPRLTTTTTTTTTTKRPRPTTTTTTTTTTKRPRPTTTTTTTTTTQPADIVASSPGGTISGDLVTGSTVWIAFDGPRTNDKANPGDAYRMTIWIFAPDNSVEQLTGQFAGNGDLNNLSSNKKQGNVWLASFKPKTSGRFWWSAQFRRFGNDGREESAGYFDERFSTFLVR